MKKILILGASGHASVMTDVFASMGTYEVVGLIAPEIPVGSYTWGLPVLGNDSDIPRIAEELGVVGYCVGVGVNLLREKIVNEVKRLAPGLRPVTGVHARACVSPRAELGDGVCIMPGAIVNAGCTIADGCVVNTGATIDHDTVLHPYANIAPGAHLGGNCDIGARAFVGIGATVIHGCKIGVDAVVGAGAVVIRDVDALSVCCGVPAKIIKKREPTDRYL